MTANLSRRKLLIAGSAGAAGLILPGRALAAEMPEIEPMAMVTRNYLGATGCALYYEPTGKATSLTFNSTFYNQLAEWRTYMDSNAPVSWGSPWRIYSYGAYTDKPGMHGQGRAFDIGRILFRNSSTGADSTVSMRYDVWKNYSNAATYQRRYWGTAAGYMRWFRHVLTYKDNSQHHNHMHVDNQVYGGGAATFNTGSSSQIYIVQGACRYVWGLGTGVDGSWGPETQGDSTAVLRRIGRTSGSITSAANFTAFCTASLRKGLGTQAY